MPLDASMLGLLLLVALLSFLYISALRALP
jgi:hypothetical protein